MSVSEVELVFGPRRQYRLTVDINMLCDLRKLTLSTRDYNFTMKFVKQVLHIGDQPVMDKDGRKLHRVTKRREPTNVYWA